MAIKFTQAQQARLDAAKKQQMELLSRDVQSGPLMPLISTATEQAGATTTPLLAAKDQGAMPESTVYEPINIETPTSVTPTTDLNVPTAKNLELEGVEEKTGDVPIIQELAKLGGFLTPENQQYVEASTLAGKQATQEAINVERERQSARATRSTPNLMGAETTRDFREILSSEIGEDADGTPPKLFSSEETVDNVIGRGRLVNNALLSRATPILSADPNANPLAAKVQGFIGNNLWDAQQQTFKSSVGTAAAISFLELARDIANKKDDATDFSQAEVDNDSFSPDMVKERIAKKVINKLFDNPNVGAEQNQRLDYGGAAELVDPEIMSALEPLFYESFVEQGFFKVQDLNEFDPTTDLVENQLTLSDTGQQFLNENQILLDDLQPDQRVDVSSLPVFVEAYGGRERELGDKAKPISKKGKSSRNTAFEDSVKLKLGFMPMRIDKDGLTYAQMMLEDTLTPMSEFDGSAGVTFNQKRFVFKQPSKGGFFFSEGEFAKTLGLDFSKWMEAKETALKRYGSEEVGKANDQADKVMRMRARAIMRTIEDAIKNKDKAFYNKWMHSSSVGRYFVLNTVLNPQTDKLARSMVVSAEKLLVDLNNPLKGRDKRRLDNWKYIIGKNLLDPDIKNNYNKTGGLRTEDMQWNAIVRLSNEVFNNPNGDTYQQWLRTGRELREAFNSNDINKLKAITRDGNPHAKAMKKNGEWSYKMQSYIDFANFHDAKQKPSGQPAYFEMRATTQHDGKQNGIAIQAMQSGKQEMLELVGMMYNADSESVIPQGDIRDSFLKKAIDSTSTVFAENETKIKFWDAVLDQIKKTRGPDRAELIKALSKTPLMESSYGKPKEFHIETAIEFIRSEEGRLLIQKATAQVPGISNIDDYFDYQVYSDLNNLIGESLSQTLDLNKQRMYKQAGQLWAMFGADVRLRGPLGTYIYMGTNEHFKTGQTIEIPTPEGTTKLVDLTRSEYTASSGKRKTTRRYNFETNQYEVTNRSKFGQLVANQLPVLTVQQIDAAIMARTIDAVNKSFTKGAAKAGFERPKFMIPVHDAIITNADAVDVYHREINNQFRKVNQEYSISKAVYQGLQESYSKFKKMIDANPGKVVELSYDSKYRAVHDYLVGIEDKINKRRGEVITATGTEPGDVAISNFDQSILNLAREGGNWSREGGEISFKNLGRIVEKIEKKLNPIAAIKNRHQQIEANKPFIWKMLSAMGYQYN